MAFDPGASLKAAANAAIAAVGANIPNISDYLEEIRNSHGARLKLVMEFYANQQIDKEDLREKLLEEENTYKLQLESSQYQDKALLQVALNAFINNLYSAVPQRG